MPYILAYKSKNFGQILDNIFSMGNASQHKHGDQIDKSQLQTNGFIQHRKQFVFFSKILSVSRFGSVRFTFKLKFQDRFAQARFAQARFGPKNWFGSVGPHGLSIQVFAIYSRHLFRQVKVLQIKATMDVCICQCFNQSQ